MVHLLYSPMPAPLCPKSHSLGIEIVCSPATGILRQSIPWLNNIRRTLCYSFRLYCLLRNECRALATIEPSQPRHPRNCLFIPHKIRPKPNCLVVVNSVAALLTNYKLQSSRSLTNAVILDSSHETRSRMPNPRFLSPHDHRISINAAKM